MNNIFIKYNKFQKYKKEAISILSNTFSEEDNKKINIDDVHFLSKDTEYQLSFMNDELIGFCCYFVADDKLLKNDNIHMDNLREQGVKDGDVYLYNFCVKDGYRGNGVGSLMLKEAMLYYRGKRIILFVEGSNSGGVKLYNRFGFGAMLATPNGFVMSKDV